MKNRPTPVAYPTTPEEEYRWGFDIHKPDGTPMAWIIDWTAMPGWQTSHERTMQLLKMAVPEDLSLLTVDDLIAVLGARRQGTVYADLVTLQEVVGKEKAMEVYTRTANPFGQDKWKAIQANFGSPLPLDKIIWYQDITHLFYGPGMKTQSWCDDRKAVCSRIECATAPLPGMEHMSEYCRAACTSATEGYMAAEPGLLVVRVPGEKPDDKRCVHVWTYDRGVIEEMPDELKARIPESTRKVLIQRGVRL